MDRTLEAVVFDLDGVVTRTERLHFAAWKQVFDDVLRDRPARAGEDHRPFDPDDYLAHVDGRPRLEGVHAFLASRGIAALAGDTVRDADAIRRLADRKNARFLDLIEREGAEVDPAMVRLIHELRARAVRVGLATSSRNGQAVLRRSGLSDLFEAQVDGVAMGELGLRGKPAPDLFLECARRLGAAPAQAAVFEDAVSGIAAARAGGFRLAVGIDRGGNRTGLRDAGADWIVQDTGTLSADRVLAQAAARGDARPNALAAWATVARALEAHLPGSAAKTAGGPRLAVFLDYDGTLTPIVARPDLARLADDTRDALRRLSRAWPTSIVSGRGLEDVRGLVGIESLVYAGSHGFDIALPPGATARAPIALDIEPAVHRAAADLRQTIGGVPGVLIEDKRFSVAVHYRLVDPTRVAAIERAVDQVLAGHAGLQKALGKKVFELRPAQDWDKGKALLWLLDALDLGDAYPIYVGDDVTDEDAFDAVRDHGLGILVAELPRPTAALYLLQDPFEVRLLLDRLADLAGAGPTSQETL